MVQLGRINKLECILLIFTYLSSGFYMEWGNDKKLGWLLWETYWFSWMEKDLANSIPLVQTTQGLDEMSFVTRKKYMGKETGKVAWSTQWIYFTLYEKHSQRCSHGVNVKKYMKGRWSKPAPLVLYSLARSYHDRLSSLILFLALFGSNKLCYQRTGFSRSDIAKVH